MTREEAKQLWPMIKLLSEHGSAVLECKKKDRDEWRPVVHLFDLDAHTMCEYEVRLKPQPKLRPWKRSDIPVGGLLRHKQDHSQVSVIIGVKSDGDGDFVTTPIGGDIMNMAPSVLMEHYEHSTDGGKTFHPCGVSEEAS